MSLLKIQSALQAVRINLRQNVLRDQNRHFGVRSGSKSVRATEKRVSRQPSLDGASTTPLRGQKASIVVLPDAPKKPENAFLSFAATARDRIKQENPGIGATEVAKRIGSEWKSLDEQKRKVYIKEANQKFEKYAKEMEKFHLSLAPEQFEEHTRLKVEDKLNKSKKRLAALERELEKPKQPGYAFTFFLRESIKEVDPEKQTFQAIGKQWKNLSESEKQVYVRKAEEAMTKYKQDMELYKQRVAQSKEHSKKLVALTSSISDLKKQLRNFKSP